MEGSDAIPPLSTEVTVAVYFRACTTCTTDINDVNIALVVTGKPLGLWLWGKMGISQNHRPCPHPMRAFCLTLCMTLSNKARHNSTQDIVKILHEAYLIKL